MNNLLKLGSSGNLVTKIQQILCQNGFTCTINGQYDQNTVSSVKSFQQANKLHPDGVVGPLTFESLLNVDKNSKIDLFCHAIQSREGFFAPGENPQYPNGTPAWANNNPGDINWDNQPNAIQNGRFAKFDTYTDGYNYLKNMIIDACTGQSKIYKPTMSIQDFFNLYSPSDDNNDPISYATEVSEKIGCTVDTLIENLL